MVIEPKAIYTVVLVALLLFFIYLTQNILGRRLRGLKGYSRFLYFLTVIMVLATLATIGYAWGFFDLLIGSLTAAGVLGLIVGLAILPLVTDMINGILIHLDREIDVGVDVEIDGKRGVVNEISLTRTKILNKEYTILVPNRKFRENVIIIRKKEAST